LTLADVRQQQRRIKGLDDGGPLISIVAMLSPAFTPAGGSARQDSPSAETVLPL